MFRLLKQVILNGAKFSDTKSAGNSAAFITSPQPTLNLWKNSSISLARRASYNRRSNLILEKSELYRVETFIQSSIELVFYSRS